MKKCFMFVLGQLEHNVISLISAKPEKALQLDARHKISTEVSCVVLHVLDLPLTPE